LFILQEICEGILFNCKAVSLTQENQMKFIWSESCQEAFEKFKKKLISSSVLSFPTEDEEFILDTDASNHGIGAVLSQIQEGKERIFVFYSRVFSKAEKNYCVTRRELLAVVKSLKIFHHYLYRRRFQMRTDHISFRWLIYFRDLKSQMVRIYLIGTSAVL